MSAFLLALLGSVVSAVLPVVVAWVKKLVPIPLAANGTHTTEELAAYRATVRQWVSDAMVEIGNALVKNGVVPVWLQLELPLIEQLVATALNSALDAAGL